MNITLKELVGERVKLVPMEMSHVQGLFEAGNDPKVWTHLSKTVETMEQMKAVVEEALSKKADGIEFPFVIMLKDSNKIVGSTRFLDISHVNQHLEIGWTWYNPAVWGTNINTECKYLLFKYCFEQLQTIRVQLKADILNVRSQNAIAKIGATKEGILRNHVIRKDGTYRDSVYFSVIQEEWPTVKEKLELMLVK